MTNLVIKINVNQSPTSPVDKQNNLLGLIQVRLNKRKKFKTNECWYIVNCYIFCQIHEESGIRWLKQSIEERIYMINSGIIPYCFLIKVFFCDFIQINPISDIQIIHDYLS